MLTLDEYLQNEPQYVQAVAGFMVRDDQILLGLRKKVSNDLGANNYAGIGGKLEPGETNDECLVREIKEEIDIDITGYEKYGRARFINPANPKWNMEGFFYLITEWEGTPTETEVIKPVWFDKDKIPFNQMFRDNKYWLPMLLENKHFEGVFLFGEDHEVKEMQINEVGGDKK